MRASRALAVAAAACAAVGLSAPLAAAGGDTRDNSPFTVSVSPRSVHQGGALHITVRGCNRGGTVTSNAFPTVRLTEERDNRAANGNNANGNNANNANGNNNNAGGNGGDGRGNQNNNANNANNNAGGNGDRGNVLTATARIHDHASPGEYNLAVRCNDNPRVETAEFTVLSGRGALGGIGGSVGPTSVETAVGAGLIATAALGGTFFLVRRRGALGGRA
jgi:hypothetical protein